MTEMPDLSDYGFDPDVKFLAMFNEQGEKLIEFKTKQDFDDWAHAVQTLVELRKKLKERVPKLRRMAEGAAVQGSNEDRYWHRAEESNYILDWIDSKPARR